MAKLEHYRYKPTDEPNEFINVSAAVGRTHAENHPDDVKVVQALLIYLDPYKRGFAKNQGPEWPTGVFDDATHWAIREYQRHVNRRPHQRFRVIEDERVSPALGKYAFGRSAYIWTITSLNYDALEMSLLAGHAGGYVNSICRRFSEVKAALKIA